MLQDETTVPATNANTMETLPVELENTGSTASNNEEVRLKTPQQPSSISGGVEERGQSLHQVRVDQARLKGMLREIWKQVKQRGGS